MVSAIRKENSMKPKERREVGIVKGGSRKKLIISNKHQTGVAGIHIDRNTGKNAITVIRGAPASLTVDEIDIDADTAAARNSENQANTELEGQLADIDEAGSEIYDFERYDFDEVPETKGVVSEAIDDIHTTLTNPKETKRNVAEKLVECVRFFGRGKKGM